MFEALEAVDACGTRALVVSSAERPVDLLRLVYRTRVIKARVTVSATLVASDER